MCRSALALLLTLGVASADEPPPDSTAPAGPSSTFRTIAPEAPAPEPPPPSTPSGTTPAPTPPSPAPLPPIPAPALVTPPAPATSPPRPSYARVHPKTGVLIAGVGMLVAGYVGDVGFTYGYDHAPRTTSLIPIAGPWLQLSQHYGLSGPPIDTGSATADQTAKKMVNSADSTIRGLAIAGEVACGALQAIGVVMIVAGAIGTHKVARVFARDEKGGTFVSNRDSGGVAVDLTTGSFLLHF